MNDSTRVEVMLCCRLLHLIVVGGTSNNGKLLELSTKVIEEPLQGLDQKRSRNLRTRCARVERILVEPFVDKVHGSKLALIVYHFINGLIDEDYLVVPQESNFSKLANTLFELITKHLPIDSIDFEKVNKSAEKQAKSWRKNLFDMGYFCLQK
jgi:hypothetical protein